MSTETRTPQREVFSVVGRSTTHEDFAQKVGGALIYADDWRAPGMLHGKIVRAQVSSAPILSIDVSEAASLAGVQTVLTAQDVPNNLIVEEPSGLGVAPIGMPVLADGRVRYLGEPLALVAAESAVIAEEAAERIRVDYGDAEEGVFDAEAALDPEAAAVHEGGNVLVSWHFGRDDVDALLAGADVVVEGTYRTQHVDHVYLEPEAGVGWIDGDGVVTLRVSTQVVEHARTIAHILGLPQSKVRVMGAYMGGGFGGKEDMTIEPFLALLVWRTRRPVRMAWSRQESLQARPKRHPFVMHYRTGVNHEGKIVAQDVRILGDAGAYPLLSSRVLFAAGVTACGPYRTPAARVEATAVLTNNVPSSAFRGFGAMQVVFGYESQMDRLAEELGLSRTEIRERNFLQRGDTLVTDEELETVVALPETLRSALGMLERDRDETGPRSIPHKRVGRGFACNMQPYGRSRHFSDRATCWIGLERDGSVTIRAGITDLGGGQSASLAQIAAEVLGVDLDRVSVHIADTALTPSTGGTFATRQLYMSGNAVLKTARELRDMIAPVAADLLGVTVDGLMFLHNRVAVAGDEQRFLSAAELAKACEDRDLLPRHLGTFIAERGDFDPRTGKGKTFPDYTFGTHSCEVEVDTETGEVTVLRYVACHDVGRAINPQRVEGQIQGGAVQGIGYALLEDCAIEEGIPRVGLLADYLVPLATTVPDISTDVLEIGPGKGPFGARGIGETPIAPCAAALANAIADAVGARLTELPLTPERVLKGIEEAASGVRQGV